MADKANLETFKELIHEGDLVTLKRSVRFPTLGVVKFKRKVFYNDLWTPELEWCRGTVVRLDDYEPVATPFRKIYNHGLEARADEIRDDEQVLAVQKVNGFMIAMTYDPDYGVLISTTGGLDSDFSQFAIDAVNKYTANRKFWNTIHSRPRMTWLFEVVHPSDPHIIQELPGLHFLALKTSSKLKFDYAFPHVGLSAPGDVVPVDDLASAGVHFPWVGRTSFDIIKGMAKSTKCEGFVVYSAEDYRIGNTVKIKSNYYLVTKLFARDQIRYILGGGAKARLDEEFYPVIDFVSQNKGVFVASSEQEKVKMIRDFLDEKIYGGYFAG